MLKCRLFFSFLHDYTISLHMITLQLDNDFFISNFIYLKKKKHKKGHNPCKWGEYAKDEPTKKNIRKSFFFINNKFY